MPNFTLRNHFFDAPIEHAADGQEDNQGGDNECPDVGDARGNRLVNRRSPVPLATSATLALGQYVRILTASYIYYT